MVVLALFGQRIAHQHFWHTRRKQAVVAGRGGWRLAWGGEGEMTRDQHRGGINRRTAALPLLLPDVW